MKRLIVGIFGASGVIYGIRTLKILRAVARFELHLVMSKFVRLNIEIETDYTPQYVEDLADEVHNAGNQAAPISSGSFRTEGMIVAPCSMRSLGAIANSLADNLLTRAANAGFLQSSGNDRRHRLDQAAGAARSGGRGRTPPADGRHVRGEDAVREVDQLVDRAGDDRQLAGQFEEHDGRLMAPVAA